MRWLVFLLILLAACAPTVQEEQIQCSWPEIPSNGKCCRDLNENGVCDVEEFAEEIEEQKQQEYEEAAKKAKEKFEKSGTLKRTIMNELYENATAITSYKFLYNGDQVIVANGSVVRELVNEHDLGIKEIEGRRQKVIINTVALDFIAKKATGTCKPEPRLVAQERSTPCDAIIDMEFEVPYDEFAFRLPIEWLRDFLHRTPYEALPGSEIGRSKTMLYRFTDLQDANRKTNLWIDTIIQMPLRVEVWQNDKLVKRVQYDDLFII